MTSTEQLERIEPTGATIESLAGADTDETRLTIYLPTHRHHPESGQDPVRLANLLRNANGCLDRAGCDRRARDAIMRPAKLLVDDPSFWRYSGDGLGLFLAERGGRYCRLPYTVPEIVFAGPMFAVRYLIPASVMQVDCFVLALSRGSIRLFRAAGQGLEPMELPGAPRSMDDLASFIDAEKSVQYHTGTPRDTRAERSAVFHGHGAGQDDDSTRLRELLVIVDRCLCRKLASRPIDPLILAADDSVAGVYRNASSYPNIAERGVSGNVDHLKDAQLLERVNPIRDAIGAERRRRQVAWFEQERARSRATTDVDDIASAAAGGKVDLLIAPWRPDPVGSDNASSPSAGAPRLERAIADTLRTSGAVYVVPDDEMPDGAAVAAVLRPGADARSDAFDV